MFATIIEYVVKVPTVVLRHFSLPIHVVLAIVLVFSQWAGMAHAVMHHEALQHPGSEHTLGHANQYPNEHTHEHPISSHILHDCLLFDGMATSVALPTWGHLGPAHTPQASFALPQAGKPRCDSLGAVHRVRVRGPPQFS